MNISGFGGDGKPLPLVTTTDAGADDECDGNVMVYSFRLCLTKLAGNRVPFPEPDHYDPARFEIIRRYFGLERKPILLWDLYALPGEKWDANNGIGKQFSLGLVGAGNGWCEADEAGRAAIFEQHRQYSQEMYHFLTTDPAVPEHLRKQLAEFGLCKDEFTEHNHWSPQLYVCEGRRMQGMYVVGPQDIMDQPRKDDPIVVSSFPIDSHDCQRVALKDGGVINVGTIFPVRMKGRRNGYPYHIPYRAILPKSTECKNLLVPVALSCTHVAISPIRVEPTWMVLGQSAGIAAALAAQEELAVQKLPCSKLRERLLAQRQVLELPDLQPATNSIDPKTLPGIVLDDTAAVLEGDWTHSARFKPYISKGYHHAKRNGGGISTATFRFTAPQADRYQLLMAYSAHKTRASNVPVIVKSGTQVTALTVDQTIPLPHSKHFRVVGDVTLQADVESTVSVSNANTSGFVILDALQLRPAPDDAD
jgi:hypothetical protein